MRKWLTAVVIIILALGVILDSAILWRTQDSLNQTRSQLAQLQGQLSSLGSDVAQAQTQIMQSSNSLSGYMSAVPDLVAAVAPAIVRIDITTATGTASGSGTIIDPSGVVLTNYHVIGSALSISVTTSDSHLYTGTVLASDQRRDLALVQMDSSGATFPTATLGTPADVIVGEEVIAAGFPLGTGLSGPPTFTRGIISAVRVLGDGLTYIQTDADFNAGNSGGSLLNLGGKVIGIPQSVIFTTGLDVEGIGIAVPIGDILSFVQANLK